MHYAKGRVLNIRPCLVTYSNSYIYLHLLVLIPVLKYISYTMNYKVIFSLRGLIDKIKSIARTHIPFKN